MPESSVFFIHENCLRGISKATVDKFCRQGEGEPCDWGFGKYIGGIGG